MDAGTRAARFMSAGSAGRGVSGETDRFICLLTCLQRRWARGVGLQLPGI
ncbi:hypothetical protein ACLK1Z_03655 [Escherichia coli]